MGCSALLHPARPWSTTEPPKAADGSGFPNRGRIIRETPMRSFRPSLRLAGMLLASLVTASLARAEDWLQFKFDERHSGNVPDRSVRTPLGLVGAVPLSDAIFTSPVIADGQVYIVDGAGIAYAIDAGTLQVRWRFESAGGAA